MRSDLKETTKKNNQKKNRNENFTAKTEYLNLIAHSSNVKMQSDTNLTTET